MTVEPIQLHPKLTPTPVDRRRHLRHALARIGPAGCGDEELLALVVGGRDALGVARRSLDALGGIREVATASLEELAPWMGERRAAALLAAFELGRRSAHAWPEPRWVIRTPADVAEQLVPVMGNLEREELRVVLLNTKNVATAVTSVYVGNLAGSNVRVGEVFSDAVRRHAAAVVVAHNHPSGDATPSAEDLRITGELAQAGRLLDIELLDHVVIGHGTWTSLRALGALAGVGST
jgi:DNA repair protein RadC